MLAKQLCANSINGARIQVDAIKSRCRVNLKAIQILPKLVVQGLQKDANRLAYPHCYH